MKVSDPAQQKTYYNALIERKPEYVGIFYVGVKTTNIFCISTCRARKPKFENVVFYTTFKDALEAGFRPCKVCQPTENSAEAPDQVQRAIKMVKSLTAGKVSDAQLREEGISPELVRRWFKKHHGITFQAFQRMYRMNNAYTELKGGNKSTDTAYDAGYESLSGFGYTYKKIIGDSPKNSINQNIILVDRFTTPLGPMFVGATSKGVCLLEFVDRKMLEAEFEEIQNLLQAKIIAGENDHIKQAKKEVTEYFAGDRKQFDLILDTPGTEFRQSVWSCIKTIPYGETVSYQQQAEMLGKPKAIRAVATANGLNRIAIVIPCHRIIGKDGSMTGYSGGLERKKWLLAHEKANRTEGN